MIAIMDATIVDVEYLLKMGLVVSAKSVLDSTALELKALRAAAPVCPRCRQGKVLLIFGKNSCDRCG